MAENATKKKRVDKEENGRNGVWDLYGDCLPKYYRDCGLVGTKRIADDWMKDWDASEISKNSNRVKLCGFDRKKRNNEAVFSANTNATPATIERYGTIWKNFKDFCIITGDYKSAIISDQSEGTICSHRPESASVNSLINYMKYHVMDAGMTLLDQKDGSPLKDLRGNVTKFNVLFNVVDNYDCRNKAIFEGIRDIELEG